MNFDLSPKHLAIQKMVREFAQKELLPGVIERDEAGVFPVEQYKKMADLGLIGLPYTAEYGGSGGDYLSYALAVEEVSKVEGSMGIAFSVSTSIYGGSIMNSSAPEEMKQRWMKPVTTGKTFGAFGLTEHSAGSDAAGQKTVAVKDGDSYIINGSKCFNTNGPLADCFAVFCLTDPALGTKGMTAFYVEKGTPGFEVGHIENKMGIRSAQVCDLHFMDVRVPVENMLAQPGQGFQLAMKALNGGRIGVAAQSLGIAKGAYEIARNYLVEREQFGKSLSKQQHLAFKLADMYADIAKAENLVYKAAWCKDTGKSYAIPAALAKYVASDTAMRVTTEAVQMLGGVGYMKEYHVERMMRDAKITQIYEGTNEIQRLIVSRDLFKNI